MRYQSPYKDLFKKEKPTKPKPVKGTRCRFEIALDSIVDADIISHIEKFTNKSEYVRQLIREDMKD